VSFSYYLKRLLAGGQPINLLLSQERDERGAVRSRGETAMLSGPKGTEQDLVGQCSVCGRIEALFELPGRIEQCCFECSADLAAAILLSTEIDAATLAGRSTNALVSEFSEISGRMLERSQSTELGNG